MVIFSSTVNVKQCSKFLADLSRGEAFCNKHTAKVTASPVGAFQQGETWWLGQVAILGIFISKDYW